MGQSEEQEEILEEWDQLNHNGAGPCASFHGGAVSLGGCPLAEREGCAGGIHGSHGSLVPIRIHLLWLLSED